MHYLIDHWQFWLCIGIAGPLLGFMVDQVTSKLHSILHELRELREIDLSAKREEEFQSAIALQSILHELREIHRLLDEDQDRKREQERQDKLKGSAGKSQAYKGLVTFINAGASPRDQTGHFAYSTMA